MVEKGFSEGIAYVDHIQEFTVGHGVTIDGKTFNQDLTMNDSPAFVTVKLSGLTDLKVPKHVSDAVGLADTTITVSANNEMTNASQPAFLARLSATASNVTGDATLYTIVFDAEIYDQNADYDAGTGVFTAPVDGKYLFECAYWMDGLLAAHDRAWCILVTSNRTYYSMVFDTPAGANPLTGAGGRIGVVADMDAGDTAYIMAYVQSGTKVVDISGATAYYSWFSGALIC